MTERNIVALLSSRVFTGHLSGKKLRARLPNTPRHLCRRQLWRQKCAVTFLYFFRLGDCRDGQHQCCLGDHEAPFSLPCLKVHRASLHWPIPLRAQRKNQKLQKFGEGWVRPPLSIFISMAGMDTWRWQHLDRRSNKLLWNYILDEGKKTEISIRPLADVAKTLCLLLTLKERQVMCSSEIYFGCSP